jgi:chromosomal replication initiation ATPase DnaA
MVVKRKTMNYWSVPGIKKKHREVFLWEVMREVAAWDGISVEELRTGRGRNRNNEVNPRHVVCYIMGKHGKMGEKAIAKYFGYSSRHAVAQGKLAVSKTLAWHGESRDMVEWVEMRLLGWDGKDVAFKSRRRG